MKKFTITQFRASYPNEDACLDKIFQLRYSNLICPKCESDNKFKRVKNRRSYQCPSCGFQVYPTQGTVFEKTTTPLTYWFYAIFLQTTTRNGVAAKELERQLDICYKTALRMSHQIKKLMANNNDDPFGGIIETDESVVNGSLRNKYVSFRKDPEKRNTYLSNKTVVFGMVEREGKVYAKVVDKPTTEEIEPIIRRKVEYASQIITDSSALYRNLNDDFYHYTVNHDAKEYVRGDFHTNTIEGFWSQLLSRVV